MFHYAALSLFSLGVVMLLLGAEQALGHGVHSGPLGCPVGACGITDWHLFDAASHTMFHLSLIVCSTIVALLGYFLYQRRYVFRTRNANRNIFLVSGIFLIIFGIDGFLLFDSSIPECRGFTGMGWFVFFSLGFEPMGILSNPECMTPFYAQTGITVLFAIGAFLIFYVIIEKHRDKIHCKN